MKTFNIKRFGQATLWSIINEKKTLTNNLIGFFIAYLCVITVFTGIFTGYQGGLNPYTFHQAKAICIGLWIIFGGVYTAELFRNLRTKSNRAQFFLLPATNCEKYWSRVLIGISIGLVLSTVALIAADLVQMLITYIFCGDSISVTNMIGQSIFSKEVLEAYTTGVSNNGETVNLLPSALGTLWIASVYILGGTYFRKIPAIFTTLALVALVLAIVFSVMGIFNLLFGDKNVEIEFYWDATTTAKYLVTIGASVFTVLNMWLSYRKFCKMQVI